MHAALRDGVAVHAAPRPTQAPRCSAATSYVGPVAVPRRPRIYDMQTADGVPVLEDRAAAPRLDRLDRRAEVHLLGHARAVRLLRHRADARRADDPGQDAGAAGRGVHRGARPRRRGRRDADDRLDQPPRPRRALHLAAARRRSRRRCGMPVQVQFEPPDDLAVLDEVHARGRRRGRHPHRDVRPRGARARRGGQGAVRGRGLLPHVGARGRGLRPRPRDDLRDPRDGRAARADRGGLPAGDRDGRLPVRRAAAPGARAR